MTILQIKNKFETTYNQFNNPQSIHPDPLEFLYKYQDNQDIEIVGLIASCLAYGRVAQILKAVNSVLQKLGDTPYNFILNTDNNKLFKLFKDFKYRFNTGDDIANLLIGIKYILKNKSSLKKVFSEHFHNTHNISIATELFIKDISISFPNSKNFLLPLPSNGSACKRMNLFLRWMVRKDNVDLGIWDTIPTSALLIPLDTHMFKIAKQYNMTNRKSADLITTQEITQFFKRINSTDPIKYDFALTRAGIQN